VAADGGASPKLGWDLWRDLGELLEYHFMVNALLAGAAVAVLAGAVGWVMVLRREVFAGHTLSMMAFPGASAAALAGVPAAWGYYGFCTVAALLIARVSGGRRRGAWSEETAGIAAVQAAALGAGFLMLSLYGGVLADLESQLFGTFLGVSDGRLRGLAGLTGAVLIVLALLARPLLFSSVDEDGAAARGLPVAAVSGAFLVLLGLAVAAASQVTGVLLVFALLVGPPASAQALTARPALSLLLTLLIGLAVVWVGLAISYFSVYPAGFFVTATSFVAYVCARGAAAALGRRAGARQRGGN
jgi:zinc/manganese transport system permease protein